LSEALSETLSSFLVSAGKELLTTQCYIKGHPGNQKDGIWKSLRDEKARAAVTVDFVALPGARAGELAAKI
jgi:protocatechuate 3,4-dioxygenase beta subunit